MKTKRSTFKVLFYVKRTAVRVSDGKAPVMARITIDGDIATFSAKLFVTPSLWNAEAGKVSGKSAEALEINPQLEEIKARINNHYYQILRVDDFVTSEKVRNVFLGIGVMENCILKDFQTMNREFGEMVEKKLRAKSTYNKYLTVYKHLEAFMWEKGKRTDMAYKELTKDFIDDFDSYLRNEKGLSANTLWIYTMPILSLTDIYCYNRSFLSLIKAHYPNPAKNDDDRCDYHPNPQPFVAKQVVQKKEKIKSLVALSRHIEYPFPSADCTDKK